MVARLQGRVWGGLWQATVGMLVGKVLRSSSFNPLAQQQGSPVAFDVYSIQVPSP